MYPSFKMSKAAHRDAFYECRKYLEAVPIQELFKHRRPVVSLDHNEPIKNALEVPCFVREARC